MQRPQLLLAVLASTTLATARFADASAAAPPADLGGDLVARLVELSLARIGRGPALRPVTAGTLDAHAARVEIRREGLVEWYENAPAGLEQAFTIGTRPGAKASGDLVVEPDVAGAKAHAGGGVVTLRSDAGRVLRYGGLVAKDAKGRPLAARMETPSPDRLRLVVCDRGAVYPVVIDPLLDTTPDGGIAVVASAGDVNGDGYADVIVGSFRYDTAETDGGAAFVFHGRPSLGCDVAMSQPSSGNGQPVVITSLRFTNPSFEPVETRLRLQLTLPFGVTANAIDLGAGGGFAIPAHFDRQLGPVTMFTLQPGQPRGPFSWRCALEDPHPHTGAVQAEDVAPFAFQ